MPNNIQYKTVSFYFMSGTGNSYRVACWMKEYSEKQGLTTTLLPMDKAFPDRQIEDSKETLIGFFMPTHGFTAPWSVIKFALKMPHVKHARAICVATQGRLKFGRVFIPGLSATATFIIALILAIKGYRVRGVHSINMPSNWMALHSGQKLRSVQSIINKARQPSVKFIRHILSGKRHWLTGLNIVEFLLGIFFIPISLAYLLYGKIFLAKVFYTNSRCNGCGLCSDYCPNHAIKMVGKKSSFPYWTYHCESCMRCMAYCPEQAIEVHQSWGVLVLYLSSFSIFYTLAKILTAWMPGFPLLHGVLLKRIFHYIFYLTVIGFSYLILFRVTKFPVINKLFSITTLTTIYRRYKEPGTRISDLSNYESEPIKE